MTREPDAEPTIDDFEAVVASVRESLRRALVAAYGVEVGEEATAEAMRVAWERRDEVVRMDNAAGYLYRVGQSKARPHLRWRRRRSTFPLREPEIATAQPTTELGAVVDGLARLRHEERTAIVLVRSYGYSYAEVAEILGITEAAVTNHLHRGMKRLREILGVTT